MLRVSRMHEGRVEGSKVVKGSKASIFAEMVKAIKADDQQRDMVLIAGDGHELLRVCEDVDTKEIGARLSLDSMALLLANSDFVNKLRSEVARLRRIVEYRGATDEEK